LFYFIDHGHEVSTARGRLEGALQILIEKTESEDSDESDVDVTDLIHEGRRYCKRYIKNSKKLFIDFYDCVVNQHLPGNQEQ
jgi:hypothetical protein